MCECCGTINRRLPTYLFYCEGTYNQFHQIGADCVPAFVERFPCENDIPAPKPPVSDFSTNSEDVGKYTPFNVLRTALEVRTHDSWLEGFVQVVTDVIAYRSSMLGVVHWDANRFQYVQRVNDLIVEADSAAHVYKAHDILAWLAGHHESAAGDATLPSDLSDLAIVASLPFVEPRHIPLLCTAVARYEKHLATPVKDKPALKGKHFGVIGERCVADVTVLRLEQKPDNEFGPCFLLTMLTSTGEKLNWWTGESCKLEEGQSYHVKLTPKGHTDWQGENVTRVSHVAEYVEPPPKQTKPRKPRTT